MITIDDYFGCYAKHPDAIPGKWAVADAMLEKVNALLKAAEDCGIDLPVNPRTGTQISGGENGGFRPNTCSVGAPLSNHKRARAVDVFDPGEELDAWLTDELLKQFGLWREAPDYTKGWVHLQDVAPKSGKRTFLP